MASILKSCLSYVGGQDVKPFGLIEKIEKDGSVSESYVEPEKLLTTCFKGQLVQLSYPKHTLDRFYYHLEMNFK